MTALLFKRAKRRDAQIVVLHMVHLFSVNTAMTGGLKTI
jgi:hypothetical protein